MHCTKLFEPKRHWAKYCSAKCRYAHFLADQSEALRIRREEQAKMTKSKYSHDEGHLVGMARALTAIWLNEQGFWVYENGMRKSRDIEFAIIDMQTGDVFAVDMQVVGCLAVEKPGFECPPQVSVRTMFVDIEQNKLWWEGEKVVA